MRRTGILGSLRGIRELARNWVRRNDLRLPFTSGTLPGSPEPGPGGLDKGLTRPAGQGRSILVHSAAVASPLQNGTVPIWAGTARGAMGDLTATRTGAGTRLALARIMPTHAQAHATGHPAYDPKRDGRFEGDGSRHRKQRGYAIWLALETGNRTMYVPTSCNIQTPASRTLRKP